MESNNQTKPALPSPQLDAACDELIEILASVAHLTNLIVTVERLIRRNKESSGTTSFLDRLLSRIPKLYLRFTTIDTTPLSLHFGALSRAQLPACVFQCSAASRVELTIKVLQAFFDLFLEEIRNPPARQGDGVKLSSRARRRKGQKAVYGPDKETWATLFTRIAKAIAHRQVITGSQLLALEHNVREELSLLKEEKTLADLQDRYQSLFHNEKATATPVNAMESRAKPHIENKVLRFGRFRVRLNTVARQNVLKILVKAYPRFLTADEILDGLLDRNCPAHNVAQTLSLLVKRDSHAKSIILMPGRSHRGGYGIVPYELITNSNEEFRQDN